MSKNGLKHPPPAASLTVGCLIAVIMMLKVMEIIGYCPAAALHMCRAAVAHTQQIWMEQTVIRRLNGFSVVVNCSLCGKVEKSMMGYEQGSAQLFLSPFLRRLPNFQTTDV